MYDSFFSLIFYVILSVYNTNEILFGVLEDHYDDFRPCLIFIPLYFFPLVDRNHSFSSGRNENIAGLALSSDFENYHGILVGGL